jgi:CubicO group peptidase (beta-lactamase class C family)
MPSLDAETTDRIERLVRDVAREESIPGASVAVFDGDDEWATGVGSRDLASNAPATPETVYGLGSCTKSLTALVVLRLQEAGALDVHDSATDHADVPVPDEVTLHHLLTHSSGYPSLGVAEELLARDLDFGTAGVPLGSRADFHDHVATAADDRLDVGERFMYCNSGYNLLDEVIEAVDGRSFTEYATEEVLDPLGMRRSTFAVERVREMDDALTAYRLGDDGPERADLPTSFVSAASGGLYGSVRDCIPYLRVHAEGGAVAGTRLLDAETIAEAHAPQVDTPDGPYGYGWGRRAPFGEPIVGHSGSLGVSSAYLGFTPESSLGVALAANTSPPYRLRVVGDAVLAIAAGHARTAVPFFERRERYDRYVGDYETHRGIRTATVERDGAYLRLEFTDEMGGVDQLVPRDGTGRDGEFWTYTMQGDRDPVRFREADGEVRLLYGRFQLRQC